MAGSGICYASVGKKFDASVSADVGVFGGVFNLQYVFFLFLCDLTPW